MGSGRGGRGCGGCGPWGLGRGGSGRQKFCKRSAIRFAQVQGFENDLQICEPNFPDLQKMKIKNQKTSGFFDFLKFATSRICKLFSFP